MTNKNLYLLLGAGVLIFTSGGGLGYLVATKKLEQKYSDLAEKEIDHAREYYHKLRKTGDFSSPEKLAESYSDKVQNYKAPEDTDQEFGHSSEKIMKEPEKQDPPEELRVENEPTEKNVWEEAKDEPPIDLEMMDILKHRNREEPYVLTEEEFMLAEPEYDQTTVTYYEDDDVLADAQDQIIQEVDKTVGWKNIAQFGLYTGDPNRVYVRNEQIELDFEVIKNTGKYTEQVLGFIEHSSKPRPKKFRGYNE